MIVLLKKGPGIIFMKMVKLKKTSIIGTTVIETQPFGLMSIPTTKLN